ncbi:MAG: inositol monophosphatase family protein [Actinomycetota bacterium]
MPSSLVPEVAPVPHDGGGVHDQPQAQVAALGMVADDVESLRSFAVELALETGRLLLGTRATGHTAKSSPTDIATDADRAAEELIVRRLRSRRPKDSLLAEEGSLHSGTSGNRWVVDPLDGTVNFIYGIPHWAVSIGLDGSHRLGVIHDPSRAETFTDVSHLAPSSQTDLSQALIATGFSYSAHTRARQGQTMARVAPLVRDLRRGGSLALDLAWVACGRLDALYETDVKPWDICAGIAILEAAGGVARTIGPMVIAAGNETLLARLLELVLAGPEAI